MGAIVMLVLAHMISLLIDGWSAPEWDASKVVLKYPTIFYISKLGYYKTLTNQKKLNEQLRCVHTYGPISPATAKVCTNS